MPQTTAWRHVPSGIGDILVLATAHVQSDQSGVLCHNAHVVPLAPSTLLPTRRASASAPQEWRPIPPIFAPSFPRQRCGRQRYRRYHRRPCLPPQPSTRRRCFHQPLQAFRRCRRQEQHPFLASPPHFHLQPVAPLPPPKTTRKVVAAAAATWRLPQLAPQEVAVR